MTMEDGIFSIQRTLDKFFPSEEITFPDYLSAGYIKYAVFFHLNERAPKPLTKGI